MAAFLTPIGNTPVTVPEYGKEPFHWTTMRHTELTLDEMLSDTIVQLTMQRDGVSESQVRAVMESLRRHRSADTCSGTKDVLPQAA